MGNSLVKIPLAQVLDRLGWKGVGAGDVYAFEGQPLIIANRGNASAREILRFAEMLSEDVFIKTKIKIEREVVYVASDH